MNATQRNIERIATGAARNAALSWFKLGALQRFTGVECEGASVDGVMLTFKYPPRNHATLVGKLLAIMRYINASKEAQTLFGSLIDDGIYTIMIVPRSAYASGGNPNGPVNPATRTNAQTKPQAVPIKWEDLPMVLSQLETFLQQPEVRAELQHDDETLDDYELIADESGSGEIEFYVWMQAHEHRTTVRYILTADKDHKPIELTRSSEDHECSACYAEMKEEDRLWRRPI